MNSPDDVGATKVIFKYFVKPSDTEEPFIVKGEDIGWENRDYAHTIAFPEGAEQFVVRYSTNLDGYEVHESSAVRDLGTAVEFDCGEIFWLKAGRSRSQAYLESSRRSRELLNAGQTEKAIDAAKYAAVVASRPEELMVATRLIADAESSRGEEWQASSDFIAALERIDPEKVSPNVYACFAAETFDKIELEAEALKIARDPRTGLRLVKAEEHQERQGATEKFLELHKILEKNDRAYSEKFSKEYDLQKEKLGSPGAAKENILRERLERSPFRGFDR